MAKQLNVDLVMHADTFQAKKKDAKKGRNPRTGEVVEIPARVAVTIKAGSKLKDALN